MSSLRIFKILFVLGALNAGTIYPAVTAASDLSYNDAREFLESVTKVKTKNGELPLRWVKPIYVYLDLKNDEILTRHINEQISRINKEVGGLTVVVTPVKKISKFTIELVKENEFLEKVGMFLSGPDDSCISKFSSIEGEFQEVSIIIRDNGKRQAELHCVERGILSSLGVGDPQANGALLINSVLMPYDANILNLSSLDILLLNFAYSKTEIDKEKYIKQFQINSTFDRDVWESKDSLKNSLLYLSSPNVEASEAKQKIENIVKLRDKAIGYSYLSYFPRLFTFNSLAIDLSPLSWDLLKNVKEMCKSCFLNLFMVKIDKANINNIDEAKILLRELTQNYNAKTDTPIIKAKIIFSKGSTDSKDEKLGEELLEAKSLLKNYYNESEYIIALRMMLAKWYYSKGQIDAASNEIIENYRLFNGSIIHPIHEARYLLDSVEFFFRVGSIDRAQNYLNEANVRLSRFKDISEEARQELANLENAKKLYKLQ